MDGAIKVILILPFFCGSTVVWANIRFIGGEKEAMKELWAFAVGHRNA